MRVEALTCKELVELVTDYLEGTLPPAEQTRFEEHLGVCSGCRHYLEQMRQTVRALGTLTEETIEPPARDTLLHLFRDWKKQNSL
jgi:predicted anti-sigma-YlaC factor YlaD